MYATELTKQMFSPYIVTFKTLLMKIGSENRNQMHKKPI